MQIYITLVQSKWEICEEKLDVISWLKKGERIIDICCNVRFAHSSICKIRDNADSTESGKSGTEVSE